MFLRVAGSGGILGGSGELETNKDGGDNVNRYYEGGENTALDVFSAPLAVPIPRRRFYHARHRLLTFIVSSQSDLR